MDIFLGTTHIQQEILRRSIFPEKSFLFLRVGSQPVILIFSLKNINECQLPKKIPVTVTNHRNDPTASLVMWSNEFYGFLHRIMGDSMAVSAQKPTLAQVMSSVQLISGLVFAVLTRWCVYEVCNLLSFLRLLCFFHFWVYRAFFLPILLWMKIVFIGS